GRAVAVLRADVLTDYGVVGGEVGEAHRRFRLVDVLAAGAARAHRVDPHVGFLDVHGDAIVDHRINVDAGEGGVPARVGVEWRNAHQAMHAVLGLEPAEGVVALHLDGGRLDAG